MPPLTPPGLPPSRSEFEVRSLRTRRVGEGRGGEGRGDPWDFPGTSLARGPWDFPGTSLGRGGSSRAPREPGELAANSSNPVHSE